MKFGRFWSHPEKLQNYLLCLNYLNKIMEKKLPEWPESLPPPTSITMGEKMHYMSPDEFKDSSEFTKLLHDMYWFPDDLYFVFTKEGEGLGSQFSKSIENTGIEIKKIENYFYPHPNPGYKNDYVHLPPGEMNFEWQREASKKQMYVRFNLKLATWKKKELDIAYAAEATTNALSKNEPIIEAKPGFAGFSINLVSVWKKKYVKNYHSKLA